MITTNLTLTNGVTSEAPVQVTGITFEVDSKLAVSPSVVFPLDVAIDSSEIVGIDFDETLYTGDYTESITINTLGGRHDIVHAVTIDDLTPEVIISLNGRIVTDPATYIRYLVDDVNQPNSLRMIEEFEIMKKEILASKLISIPITSVGTRYYIDATGGDDLNDGLSELTAWQTLAKVEATSFTEGSVVLFKRGETFIGTSYFGNNVNGNASTPTIIGSYGADGVAQPVLTDVQIQALTWTDNTDGTWTATIVGDLPIRLWENGQEILRSTDEVDEPLSDYFRWIEFNDGVNKIKVFNDPIGKDYSFATTTYPFQVATTFAQFQDIDFQGGTLSSIQHDFSDDVDYKNISVGSNGTGGILIGNTSRTTLTDILSDSLFNLDSSLGVNSGRGAADAISIVDNSTEVDISRVFAKNWCHSSLAITADATTNNNTVSNFYSTSPDLYYGGRVGVDGLTHSNTLENIYIYDVAVRSQLNATNNIYRNIVVNEVRESKFKADVAQGLSASSYYENAASNLYENIIILNSHSSGFAFIDDAINEVSSNTLTNLLIINCGNAVNIKDNAFVHDNTINGVAIYGGTDTQMIYNDIPYSANEFEALSPLFSNISFNGDFVYDTGLRSTTGGATSLSEIQYVDTEVSLVDGDSWSIMGRIKIVETDAYKGILANYYSANSCGFSIDNLFFWVDTLAGGVVVNDIPAVLGEEYHLALSVKSKEYIKFFINGELHSSTALNGDSTSHLSNTFHIGADGSGEIQGDAELKDTYLFNYAVSDDMVSRAVHTPKEFFLDNDSLLNMPLNEVGATKTNHADSSVHTVVAYDVGSDVQGGSTGLQKIELLADSSDAINMGFDAIQANQQVIAVPTAAHSALEVIGGVNHLYTNDTVGGLHYYIGAIEQAVPTEIVGFFDMNDVSEISGLAVSERELFEVYDGIKVAI